jgi:hypothetical protein
VGFEGFTLIMDKVSPVFHLYLKGPVPPDGRAVKVVDCPGHISKIPDTETVGFGIKLMATFAVPKQPLLSATFILSAAGEEKDFVSVAVVVPSFHK